MTLDQLISDLSALRDELGPDAEVYLAVQGGQEPVSDARLIDPGDDGEYVLIQ